MGAKADATNLYVYIGGQPFRTFIRSKLTEAHESADTSAIDAVPECFQSEGGGQHAEQRFLTQLQAWQQHIPDGTQVLLQMNKSPCATCVPDVIMPMLQTYSRFTFKIEMIGLDPGNLQSGGTTAGHLAQMEEEGAELDLDLIDIDAVIQSTRAILERKLRDAILGTLDRNPYQAEVTRRMQRLRSHRNGINDSIERLGNDRGNSDFGQKLRTARNTLVAEVGAGQNQQGYLPEWRQWNGHIGTVKDWHNGLMQARSQYWDYDEQANIEYIDQQLFTIAADRAAVVADLTDQGLIAHLNQWIDYIRTTYLTDREWFANQRASTQKGKRRPDERNDDDEGQSGVNKRAKGATEAPKEQQGTPLQQPLLVVGNS